VAREAATTSEPLVKDSHLTHHAPALYQTHFLHADLSRSTLSFSHFSLISKITQFSLVWHALRTPSGHNRSCISEEKTLGKVFALRCEIFVMKATEKHVDIRCRENVKREQRK
jgi:hypothetical protein